MVKAREGEAERSDLDRAAQLARIEGKLDELLREVKGRKRKSLKRRGTVYDRSAALAEREPAEYQPTELQRARARKALGMR
jgi:hypothetical protein